VDSEWIIRVDADDWLHPDCLDTLMRAAEFSRADLICPDYYLVDKNGNVLQRVFRCENIIGAGNEQSPLAAGCLIRRSCWESLGGYNEALSHQEDFEFWLKVIEGFRVKHVPEPLLYYRQHSGSMSRKRWPRAKARRLVKREAVLRRGRTVPSAGVPVIVTTISPLDLFFDPDWALAKVGEHSLLEILHHKLCYYDFLRRELVVTGSHKVANWARRHGWKVKQLHSPYQACKDILAPALDHAPRGLSLLASPFFPLIQKERIPEVVDTLLLHGCTRVDTVISDGLETLVYTNRGLLSLNQDNGQGHQYGVCYRQCGGLAAVKGGNGAPAASRGFVELIRHEDFLPLDEAGLGWIEGCLNGGAKSSRTHGSPVRKGKG
jgi:hypothetical protein